MYEQTKNSDEALLEEKAQAAYREWLTSDEAKYLAPEEVGSVDGFPVPQQDSPPAPIYSTSIEEGEDPDDDDPEPGHFVAERAIDPRDGSTVTYTRVGKLPEDRRY